MRFRTENGDLTPDEMNVFVRRVRLHNVLTFNVERFCVSGWQFSLPPDREYTLPRFALERKMFS